MISTALAVAEATAIPLKGVEAVIELLDDGATVPFISRYRKERTGSLDEVAVRNIELALARRREFEKRQESIINSLKENGVLTPELRGKIENAGSLTELEDLYAPYKPKRRTRAQIAREKGLEPLAKRIMAGRSTSFREDRDSLAGACDIIAEWASETPRLRNIVRRTMHRRGTISATVTKEKSAEIAASPYAEYSGFDRPLRRCLSHQYLAMRRAEREGYLKVKYSLTDEESLLDDLCSNFGPREATEACGRLIDDAVCDAYKRLIRPSVENEIAAEMKDEADRVAIGIFSDNLRALLLAPPLTGRRVLAIDPGYRTGCKVVAIDEQGNLLADTVIYPTEPRCDTDGARKTLEQLISRHHLDVVALGDGTASRQTEDFLRKSGLVHSDALYVVSENGASVYSASDIARDEFPDKDVTVRGAVSIGRRLIDPLSELVKIDPKSIGVGQYQHDVDQPALRNALDYTVMSCVNAVGVDLNTASAKLLEYISGIGPAMASRIVDYRSANGPFTDRRALLKVPRLGAKAFEQAAGFLRVRGGANPLDNTGIHPESYPLVSEMAHRAGLSIERIIADSSLVDRLDIEAAVASGAGRQTVLDILAELRKPGRDPRTDADADAFVPEVSDFSELRIGMVLPGIVGNITAFGAFINLGIKENGLLHISQISDRRIADVGEVLKLGQKVTVRVTDIDEPRRRISLSMKGL